MNEADLNILKAERLRQEIRVENRRFILEILAALALAFGLGAAAGHLWR
jgi:hypothetical protein